MTPKKAHALLSDLHALLANYEAVDFMDAARFSPELASALKILSKKTGLDGVVAVASSGTDSPTEKARRRAPGHSSSYTDADEIRAILSQTVQAESTASIVALGKKLGFSIPASPKDSRDRALRRLSSAIASLGRDRRTQVMSQALRNANSQTQGGVDVIKGRE